MKSNSTLHGPARSLSLALGCALTLSVLTACGQAGGPSASPTGSESSSGSATPATTAAIKGFVYGATVKYPGGFAQSSAAGVDYQHSTTGESVVWSAAPVAFQNALVCVDLNDNGFCDAGEDFAISDANGAFAISTNQTGALTAHIGSGSLMIERAGGTSTPVGTDLVFRAAPDQVQANPGAVIVSALSTDVLRQMQADLVGYNAARSAVAQRLSLVSSPAAATDVSVTPDQVIADLATVTDTRVASALLFEQKALQNRSALAAATLARGFITQLGVDPVATIQVAQAAAEAPEAIPRYDHLFIVVFENHPNSLIDNPAFADFYNYLNVEGNKAANYFSMGNPSEPNYVTLASGDDWGITDDDGWNCVPAGDTADLPTDVYNPRGTCTDVASHNGKNRRNLFTTLYQAGLSTRVYSESMDPGQDPRVDGQGNTAITGANATTGVQEPFISELYMTKHQPAMHFDEVRNRPDFFRNLTRSVGGGQWDTGIAAYAQANGIAWNTHQMEDDLQSGDIGALNFVIPDQCDDIHTTGTAVSNCTEVAYVSTGILRGDSYAKYLVDTIQASPIWKNTARKVGIVLIFDEGSFFTGSSSCCGWNAGGADTSGAPLDENLPSPVPSYSDGDKGDGPTIFAVLNNQPNAPKGIVDSDTYSHISLVRTLQDMFGVADPGVPTSYMNRSKYTEAYIAAHVSQLTEYQDADQPHFDAVRPMNHSYVMKAGDRISGGVVPGTSGSGSDTGAAVSLGPDPTQTNIFAVK